MIMTKEQINRYLRHIIIPEISGTGQKRALESTVVLYAESVQSISVLVYYLVASGIGRIMCSLNNRSDCDILFDTARDLNNDIKIELFEGSLDADSLTIDCIILLGTSDFVTEIYQDISKKEENNKSIPVIISIYNQWKGLIKVYKNVQDANEFISIMKSKINLLSQPDSDLGENLGYLLSECFIGAVAAAECFMHFIPKGMELKKSFYFDLLNIEFEYMENKYNLEKYLEKLMHVDMNYMCSQEVKNNLANSKVLIVGTGGLGCPNAYALSKAGVGTIGLVDYDKVEISNLNRQILHSTSRIGMSKVKSAEYFLKKFNPKINLITHDVMLDSENAKDIIKDYDIIIVGVDNFPNRYLLNDTCFALEKPMVEAGVLTFMGSATFIKSKETPCYRCMFPEMNDNSDVQSCAEAGVLGPVPGIMGFIQASETVKYLTNTGTLLKNKILYFDISDHELFMIDTDRVDECDLCGKQPSTKTIEDYQFVCDSK